MKEKTLEQQRSENWGKRRELPQRSIWERYEMQSFHELLSWCEKDENRNSAFTDAMLYLIKLVCFGLLLLCQEYLNALSTYLLCWSYTAHVDLQVPEWLTYDFPPEVKAKLTRLWGTEWNGQAQKWSVESLGAFSSILWVYRHAKVELFSWSCVHQFSLHALNLHVSCFVWTSKFLHCLRMTYCLKSLIVICMPVQVPGQIHWEWERDQSTRRWLWKSGIFWVEVGAGWRRRQTCITLLIFAPVHLVLSFCFS